MPASFVCTGVPLLLLVTVMLVSPLLRWLLVGGVERPEREPGQDAGAELDDQVDPDRGPREGARGGGAEGHGGVERTAGDPAHGERAGQHGEPDRQAEEAVAE